MTQLNTVKKIDSNWMSTSDLSARTNSEKDATSQAVLSLVNKDDYQINSSITQENIKFDFYANSTSIKIEICSKNNSISWTNIEIPLWKFNPKNEKISDYFYIELLKNWIFFINDKRFWIYYYFQKNQDNSISQIQIHPTLQNVNINDIFDEKPKVEFNGNLYFYYREQKCVELLEEEVEQIILYNDLYIVQKGKNHIVIFYEWEIYRLKFWYFCKFIQEQLLVKPFLWKPKIIDWFENLKQYLKQ